jgi:hypothetical protein
LNSETKRTTPLGAWNIREVTRISPRRAYFDMVEKKIYTPTPTSTYHSFTAFDVGRTSRKFKYINPTEAAEVPEKIVTSRSI